MAKEGSDGHEDLRHPENRSLLREVTFKLLALRRFSLHSVLQQPIAPLPNTLSHLRRRDLHPSDLSLRAALDGLTFLARHQSGLVSESQRISSDKTLQVATNCLHHVQPHHKPTRATIPKTGRRGGDLANRLDQKFLFCLDFISTTLRQ